MLDYFRTGEPTDEFTRGLQGKVEQLRNDDEWRENRMTIEMREKLIYQQGIEQGIKSLIETCQMYQISYEKTKEALQDKFELEEERAEEFMVKYWK